MMKFSHCVYALLTPKKQIREEFIDFIDVITEEVLFDTIGKFKVTLILWIYVASVMMGHQICQE